MRKQYTKVQYDANGLKQCTKCQEYKDISAFHKYSKAQDGLKPWCKSCVREYDLNEDDNKRVFPRKVQGMLVHCRYCEQYLDKTNFYKNFTYCKECSKSIGHSANLKKYGLSVDNYIDLEKSQNGVCAICKNPEEKKKRLSVDHDHSCCPGSTSCGKCIRGLLCSNCNAMLGQARDNIETLRNAVIYLKK